MPGICQALASVPSTRGTCGLSTFPACVPLRGMWRQLLREMLVLPVWLSGWEGSRACWISGCGHNVRADQEFLRLCLKLKIPTWQCEGLEGVAPSSWYRTRSHSRERECHRGCTAPASSVPTRLPLPAQVLSHFWKLGYQKPERFSPGWSTSIPGFFLCPEGRRAIGSDLASGMV